MTTEGDDLAQRVVRLEMDVREARQEAAAALVLARASDHDVATMNEKLNGHISVLNALRETQLEHGELLREHGGRLDRLERKVDEGFARVDANFRQVDANFRQIDANFRQIEEKFAVVNAGLTHITALLTRDEERGERT